ncbi:hypothetical protein pEaSNUABM50_00431 [Erwinia phage pEa_SNUABM_50]|uniref:Uncharacterized protein n=4 Tax=Eneladusvirus BF TaxID=2560751 RepID=A0A7L8ZNS8_9CAUD|nr:hypothetical protein FDH34_gp493 [Serratia phage BF]QOI71366.1 hypothetical protein pEaSNUABM12_00437 [Erwinia phage pEa_SNUABM_12]QOI71908.1 hypothetical protein pEaSNUABM47_00433 [Erwinia phage pEa_SNUABM_47]QOI72447.1 hypothetical protein pEaSNUABM50_00431 [Erwinia phage pEa_SNUABM_50]QXO11574.1 hypothetical protein pEaSNUABM19_00437 [Erwinia phage pEa_SNUABM_19]QXO12122.1 hypothetical protein pEaSNUABM44_00435 [Erwinia phage pEa_SNUABM_44]QXO12675.1 hypothetical protein pEaSNUABM49_004
MTKAELLEILKDYSDDSCIEVVHGGAHFDITCVVPYNDNGTIIAELGIFDQKTIPESAKRVI